MKATWWCPSCLARQRFQEANPYEWVCEECKTILYQPHAVIFDEKSETYHEEEVYIIHGENGPTLMSV